MGVKKVLTREQILGAQDLQQEEIKVPEWGGSVFLRAMNGTERDILEKKIYTKDGEVNMTNLRPILLSMTLVDAAGKNLFTSKDIEALSKKNSKVLNSLALRSQVLSGMRDEDFGEELGN